MKKNNTNPFWKYVKSREQDNIEALGRDNIPNRVLKQCVDHLAPALTIIFQRSIDHGKLPNDWLNANVSCIFKKGDKHAAENYRPVSLTSVPCKLLEHIICGHLMKHLEKHNILTSLNHWFRSGYSCETQLVVTIHDMPQSFDKGKQVDIGILDFSKAKQVPANPHLGLLIAEDLKWKEHINNTCKKVSSTIRFPRRNLQHCPRECRRTAHIALVRSIMEYGSIIWDPYTKQEIRC